MARCENYCECVGFGGNLGNFSLILLNILFVVIFGNSIVGL